MLTKTLLSLLASLPNPVLSLLGYITGSVVWLLPTKKRRVCLQNIRYCLPELSGLARLVLARRSLIHEYRTLFEIPMLMTATEPRLARLIKHVSGLEHLQNGIAAGHGVILAIPHLGNWEAIGLYCSARYPMTSLYRPQHRSPALDDYIRQGRQRLGAKLVPTETSGVRALYQALAQNELVAILPDQNPGRGAGVFAPLFGHTANTMVLLSRLAHKTRAVVLLCYAERLEYGRGYHIHFEPVHEDVHNKDMLASTTSLNRDIESCVRTYPEQYWWSYKRFKVMPEGELSPYDN